MRSCKVPFSQTETFSCHFLKQKEIVFKILLPPPHSATPISPARPFLDAYRVNYMCIILDAAVIRKEGETNATIKNYIATCLKYATDRVNGGGRKSNENPEEHCE